MGQSDGWQWDKEIAGMGKLNLELMKQ